ncbi:DUF5709 domain-containing protein [Streptomyces sp. NPDC097981]|uniref:DUF5709 domain-containing protein n=1 Tax=Streptomyces sp. NPDC097981 TaxID=3155428 RepID=UPI003328E3E4
MSSTESQGDEVYQPQDADDPAQAQPDMENALDEPDLDETLDTGYSPPERPLAVADHGTTAEEQHLGETLDQRLARELPDPDAADVADWDESAETADVAPEAGPVRAGRLADTEETGPVRHISVLARDVGVNGGAASAEEAAVHLIEEEGEGEGGR